MTDPLLDEVRRFYDENHEGLERSRLARRYFYSYLTRVLQVRIPPGLRILDVGCGSGQLLSALQPSHGVGIDVSARAVAHARKLHAGTHLLRYAGLYYGGEAPIPGRPRHLDLRAGLQLTVALAAMVLFYPPSRG